MPDVDLSTLSGPDLRRLLDSTRARGQASLSYMILQEMADRRDAGGRKGRRRDGEPRTVALNLGEPEPADPFDAPPAPQADDPAGPLPGLEPGWSAAPPPRRGGWRLGLAAAAGFAGGVAATAAVALGAGWAPPGAESVPNLTPAQVMAELAAEPAPDPASAPPPPAAETPPAEALAVELAAVETTPEPIEAEAVEPPLAPPLPETAPAGEAAEAAAAADDCAAQPTPADRTICADPGLRALQRDLRRAYADALAAHEDRETLRARQLAWRDLRNPVDEPGALGAMYRERIRKLEAAAEAARRLRGA